MGLPSYKSGRDGILAFCCCVTEYHKFSGLGRHTSIHSQSPWVRKSRHSFAMAFSQGPTRLKSRASRGRGLKSEPTSRLIRVVGKVKFHVVVGLRSTFS